jgi:hypothetical protein
MGNTLSESNPTYSTGRDKFIEKRLRGERVVVWATGISGSGRKDYINLQQKLAQANGHHFEHLDVADFLWAEYGLENRRIAKENILNSDPIELASKVNMAYTAIAHLIDSHRDMDFVVSGHACLFWDGIFQSGFSSRQIETISPDLYVNIMENEVDVTALLSGKEQMYDASSQKIVGVETERSKKYGKQWKRQKLTHDQVIAWMTAEFMLMKNEADRYSMPWMGITRYMSPTTLYMAMYEPDAPWFYFMQQMTHALKDGSYSAADKLWLKLITRVAGTNPKGYELYSFTWQNRNSSTWTKYRDNHIFGAQSDKGCAAYNDPDGKNTALYGNLDTLFNLVPKQDKPKAKEIIASIQDAHTMGGPTPSEGIAVEASVMHEAGKYVDRIWTVNQKTGKRWCSPFVIASSGDIHNSQRAYLTALSKQGIKPRNIVVPQYIISDSMAPSLGRRGMIPDGAY